LDQNTHRTQQKWGKYAFLKTEKCPKTTDFDHYSSIISMVIDHHADMNAYSNSPHYYAYYGHNIRYIPK